MHADTEGSSAYQLNGTSKDAHCVFAHCADFVASIK